MTPQERREQEKIEKALRKRVLEAIKNLDNHPANPTENYMLHVSEQCDALNEDVKTGRAFAGPEWKIETRDGVILFVETGKEKDQIDAIPEHLNAWLRQHKRNTIKIRIMWASLILAVLLFLFLPFIALWIRRL